MIFPYFKGSFVIAEKIKIDTRSRVKNSPPWFG